MTRECDPAAFWDEPTFWHLLVVEAARARRARRELLLLVADVLGTRGEADSRSARWKVKAPELATALAACLRETDLVGWHRTDWMAGALLTEVDPEPEVARLVGDKVFRSLGAQLPVEVARGLRVRVYRYGTSGARCFHRLFGTTEAGAAVTGFPDVGVARSRAAEPITRPRSDATPRPQHAGAP